MCKKLMVLYLPLWIICFSPFILMAQQTEPFQTVEAFFKAFHERDSIQMQKHFAKEAQLIFTTNDKAGLPIRRKLAVKDFVQRVSSREKNPVWEERLGTPIIEIHQNLASVWVPFQFYLNDSFSHQGHNLFILFWQGKQWEILHLSDTRE